MGSNIPTVSYSRVCTAVPAQSTYFIFRISPTSSTSWHLRSGRTTTRSAKLWSTSRSTWSSTPAMSTYPWLLISTEMTKLCMDLLLSLKRTLMKKESMEWGTPLDAMEAALELEKTVNQSLLDLHKVSGDKGDSHLCDFLEAEYLSEQVEGIKELGDMIIKIKRAGDGLGLHIMDKEIGS